MSLSVGSIEYWVYISLIPLLVIMNGLIAGLTLGLLSLDNTKLQVLLTSGTNKQKLAAARIQPLRKNTHLLLATLLLGNTIINETLPLFIHKLVNNEWIAIGISVVLVLTFAELLPQALCTHYGLQIGSMFAWFVYALRFIMLPIAYPLGKFLDFLLGEQEGALYKKAELKQFVALHGQNFGGDLNPDEVKIIQGVLSSREKTVDQVMTRLENVVMLDSSTLITSEILQFIAETGHSRIPIYNKKKKNIIGILLVRNLILLDDAVPTYVSDLYLRNVPKMQKTTNCFEAINYFQQGASHLAIVVSETDEVLGICTLEDCIEELIMEEIVDESDKWTDNTYTTRVIRKARSEKKQVFKINDV